MTGVGAAPVAPGALDDLAGALASAWACWAPTLSHDDGRIAYVSDRRGAPELWVQTLEEEDPPTVIHLSDDPVLSVQWSADDHWLSCSVATGGGVRTEVWVVRPDGTDAHRVAGAPGHAVLGPWDRQGHLMVVTVRDEGPGLPNRCLLLDPETGRHDHLTAGGLVEVLDLAPDRRFALLRDGTRGAQYLQLLDRADDTRHDILLHHETGSTDLGMLRPPPPGEEAAMVAYVVTDAGRARRALVAVPLGANGGRAGAGALAQREDAELELADADDEGRSVLLAWNVQGRSELELLDTESGRRRPIAGMPGTVVRGGLLSRDGTRAILAIDGPLSPTRIWEVDAATGRWRPLTPSVTVDHPLVTPTLEQFESHDGLGVTGWLYRPPGETHGPGPAVLSIHGGPEGQERPVFNAQHQLLAAAGMVVFAPNIRGSSGFGRAFVHADDRYGRLDAIADTVACARWLVAQGLADPQRVALSGRSYGGYVTLMGLTHHPDVFAAGVDICGMSDLRTFFRDTEPWIARAAVTKYGDPERDAALLASLSPLLHVSEIRVPLLVVHGALDTNVPVGEAHQVVAALRARHHGVEYLELAGEGHEYRQLGSRWLLLRTLARFLTGILLPPRPAGQAP